MKLGALFLATFFAACGAKAKEPARPTPPYPRLEAALARVKPQLLRCSDGMPGKNGCALSDHGDTLGQASYYALGNSDEQIDMGILYSVDSDGRPWRSPRHQASRNGDFSRDHVLSLALWSVARHRFDVLSSLLEYAKAHNWRVCPDEKCLLTPGILTILGDVVEYTGGGRPYGTNIPDVVGEQQAQIEVDTLQGQALSLVVDKVLLKAMTGNLNSKWQSISRQAVNKNGDDLYFQYVNSVANGGDFLAIANKVTVELEAWSGPTPSGTFDRTGSGWQLCGLAGMLLKE